MKQCPQCAKAYDDSWKICLSCSVELVDSKETPVFIDKDTNKANKLKRKIQIIGILLIISSLMGISGVFSSFNSQNFADQPIQTPLVSEDLSEEEKKANEQAIQIQQKSIEYMQEIQKDAFYNVILYLSLVLQSILLAAGIGLLKLRKWGKNIAIGYIYYYIISMPLSIYLSMRYIEIGRTVFKDIVFMNNILIFYKYFMIIPSFLYLWFFIWALRWIKREEVNNLLTIGR